MDVILMKPSEDIKGECLLKGHEQELELLSYNHGLAMQVTSDQSNTARTSGKPMLGEFSVTKYMDAASPKLYDYLLRGADIGTVTVTIGRNDDGSVLPLIVYTLEETLISNISTGGGGGDKPVETLSMNFTRIQWEYKQQDPGVEGKGAVTAVWNIKTNTAE